MKRFVPIVVALAVAAAVSFFAFAAEKQQAEPDAEKAPAKAEFETDAEKLGYALGMQIGNDLKGIAGKIDVDALVAGLQDAHAGREPRLTQQEAIAAIKKFQMQMQKEQAQNREKMMKERAKKGEANKAEGAKFLKENKEREGVKTTESGLQYKVLRKGEGEKPGEADMVKIHYKGTLIGGEKFDSSYDRGEPAEFAVNRVIPGFTEALRLMRPGSKYRFWIPSDLAYGERGAGGQIGPNAVLIFDVELLEVQEAEQKEEPQIKLKDVKKMTE